MKMFTTIVIVIILILVGMWLSGYNSATAPSPTPTMTMTPTPQAEIFRVTSDAFPDGGKIPSLYTCDGKSINPELSITGIPAGTKSLALILHDPDAPRAGGFTHWVMFNMPVSGNSFAIDASSTPPGISGNNGSGKPGYVGACPPSGEHHYIFKVYALDSMLSLADDAGKEDVENGVTGHILGEATLVGLYSRNK